MGNKQSKNINVTDLNLDEWKQIAIHRDISKVMESTRGKGQAELQTIPFDPRRDLDKQIDIYQYRKYQDNALVKCYGVLSQKAKSHALCGDNQMLKVLTQRIPLRLNQFPQLSFPESVYTLSESLRGYKDCYNKLGSFEITDEMIGLNNQGQVKVWVNQDFAENHPTFQKPVLQTTGKGNQGDNANFVGNKDQADMVQNVIRLIEKKNQNGRFPQQFTSRIYNNSSSFDATFREIQRFSKQKNIFIPDRIMNMKNNYPNKDSYFTPGDQYNRVSNDPLYREPRQFSFEGNGQPQKLQSGRPSNIAVQNQLFPQPMRIQSPQINRISSPIHNLYQNPTFQPAVNPISSPLMNQIGSKLTFSVMSPHTSNLTFNYQNSLYPHIL